MMYDEAYGPHNPRARKWRCREWEDSLAWVDILVDAPGQVAHNVAMANARDPRNVRRCATRALRLAS